MNQTESGLKRLKCSCEECQTHCRRQSGFLIPSDIEKIAKSHSNVNNFWQLQEWAKTCLEIHPGFHVSTPSGIFQLRVLTPRMIEGKCIFLNRDNTCAVHEVAPFGCAFFGHESKIEAEEKATRGFHLVTVEIGRLQTIYNFLVVILLSLNRLSKESQGSCISNSEAYSDPIEKELFFKEHEDRIKSLNKGITDGESNNEIGQPENPEISDEIDFSMFDEENEKKDS